MARRKKIPRDNSDFTPEELREMAEATRRLLIQTWHARAQLYQELFGEYTYVTPASYAPPSEDVTAQLKRDQLRGTDVGDTGDPGDPDGESQHLAVLAYGPDPIRPYWTYVTAGLASPWLQQQPAEVSGFGCELMIKSPTDAQWPAQILRSIAYYIFNDAGRISPGVRIGLNASIAVDMESELRNLYVWYADEAPDSWYQLPSGGFGLFCVVGITEDECRYAESVDEYGTWCMQEVLRQMGHGQISDPNRASIMQRQNIEEVLANLKQFANTFRANEKAGTDDLRDDL